MNGENCDVMVMQCFLNVLVPLRKNEVRENPLFGETALLLFSFFAVGEKKKK